MKIEVVGQIWKSEANGLVYLRGGYLRPFASGRTPGSVRK